MSALTTESIDGTPGRYLRPYIPRFNSGGNFCGHDPDRPILTTLTPTPTGKGGLPRVLTLSMERLDAYYARPKVVLPSLNAANGSKRQQRSERREACIRLLKAILKMVDLVSLRVGVPSKDGFVNYTVDYIAKDTGMTLKRAERSLADLKRAGLITVSQPREIKEDGTWKGLAAVKALSKHLFGALGLEKMLKLERGKASKRLRKKQLDDRAKRKHDFESASQPANPTERARQKLASDVALNSLAFAVKPRRGSATRPPDKPSNENDQRRFTSLLIELKQQHPDWPADRIRKAAKDLL